MANTFYCSHCSKLVELVTVHQASEVSKVSRKTIYNWIAQGKIHTYLTAGGQFRICLESLIRPYQEGAVAYQGL
jgi:excisionase family DNA binding protein